MHHKYFAFIKFRVDTRTKGSTNLSKPSAYEQGHTVHFTKQWPLLIPMMLPILCDADGVVQKLAHR